MGKFFARSTAQVSCVGFAAFLSACGGLSNTSPSIQRTDTAAITTPTFKSATATVDSSGNLVITFKEEGLSAGSLVNYTASANSAVVYGCVDPSVQKPQPTNTATGAGSTSLTGPFGPATNNGVIAAVFPLPPVILPPQTCPSNQTWKLVSGSYSGVDVVDDLHLDGISIQETFQYVLDPAYKVTK
jgi:hypothetical protein